MDGKSTPYTAVFPKIIRQAIKLKMENGEHSNPERNAAKARTVTPLAACLRVLRNKRPRSP